MRMGSLRRTSKEFFRYLGEESLRNAEASRLDAVRFSNSTGSRGIVALLLWSNKFIDLRSHPGKIFPFIIWRVTKGEVPPQAARDNMQHLDLIRNSATQPLISY